MRDATTTLNCQNLRESPALVAVHGGLTAEQDPLNHSTIQSFSIPTHPDSKQAPINH